MENETLCTKIEHRRHNSVQESESPVSPDVDKIVRNDTNQLMEQKNKLTY